MALRAQDLYRSLQVFFGIYSDRVKRCFGAVDWDTVFQESKLLQAFALFKCGFRQAYESIERRLSIRVESQVFEVSRVALIAIERDRRTREVQSAARQISHDFHGIGVG